MPSTQETRPDSAVERISNPSNRHPRKDWKSVLHCGGLMETESVNWSDVADTLESLRQELTRLGERVAALEKVVGSGSLAPPASRRLDAGGDEPRRSPAEEGLSEA